MKKRKTRSRSSNPAQSREGSGRVFHQMLKAVTAGLFLLTVLLLLFSFLLSRTDVPFSLLGPAALLMLAASCMLSGFLAARAIRSRGLLVGMLCGATVYLVMLLLSFFFADQFDWQLLFKLAVCLLGGAIGGVTGVNAKTRRRVKG